MFKSDGLRDSSSKASKISLRTKHQLMAFKRAS